MHGGDVDARRDPGHAVPRIPHKVGSATRAGDIAAPTDLDVVDAYRCSELSSYQAWEQIGHEQSDTHAVARAQPASEQCPHVAPDAAVVARQIRRIYSDVHARTGTKTAEGEGRRVLVVAQLLGALVLVVVASDAFTNAVEWIGAKFGLTRSAVGAVVAALGSSLPETIVAFIALVVLRDARSQAIGIGAVIGAPLMLSTVVFSLIGVISLVRREPPGIPQLSIPVAPTLFGATLFLGTFALALAASFTRSATMHTIVAICVLAAYVVYLVYHLRAGQPEAEESPPPLRIAPRHKRPATALVVLQLCIALVVTALASRWFISSLSAASLAFGISALGMSLFLSPIATELPEASSVFLWMRRCEDNLAISNVLGAMMFQTSVACAIAMLATPWQLGISAYGAAIAALAAVALLIVTTLLRRQVEQFALAAAGVFYIGYIIFMART